MLRHWLLRISLIALTIGVPFTIFAAVARMYGDPSVVADVRSEAVVLVPDTTLLDLIATMQRRTDAPAGVPLDPAWLAVLADSVTMRLPSPRRLATELTGNALPASMLRHVELTGGCTLHIEQLSGGWIRIGVRGPRNRAAASAAGVAGAALRWQVPATTDSAASECHLRAAIWTGEAPDLADSLRPDEWLPAPSRREVEIHARLTNQRSATLHFRPANPIRFARLPVRNLRFEMQARDAIPASAILGGMVRFPTLGDATVAVHAHDVLELGAVKGMIVELSSDGELRTIFRGTASKPRINGASREPTMLQWLYHNEPVRLFISILVGLFLLVAGAIQAIRTW